MAGAFVQSVASASNIASGTGGQIAFTTQNTGAGNLLVVIVQNFANNTLLSVTDNQGGNTWVVLPGIGGSTYNFQMAYALNTTGGTKPILTFLFNGSNTNLIAIAAEYSGVNTYRATSTQATAAGQTVVTNNVSAVAGDLLFGYAMAYTTVPANPWTLGSGFSNLVTTGSALANANCAIENGTAASTGNVDATFTAPNSTANWWAGVTAFYQLNPSGGQGNSPMGNVIIDLDGGGFPIAESQLGTNA